MVGKKESIHMLFVTVPSGGRGACGPPGLGTIMYLKKSVSVSSSDGLVDSEPAMRSRKSGIGAGSNP